MNRTCTDLNTKMIKKMPSCGMKFVYLCSRQTHECTLWLMHSTAVSYFSGRLSIMHVREALTFVQDVVRLTKADTIQPLQLQELRKLVRRLPIMHAKSTDWAET